MVIFQFAMLVITRGYHFGRMSRGECSSHHSTCTDLLPFLEIGPTLWKRKNCSKTVEKNKKNKKNSFTRPLSSFSDPLYGSKLSIVCFLGGFGHFVSLTMSVAHFFCFCFPFPWVLGINFHPDKHPLAQLSPLHILYSCLHWVSDFGYWAIRENVQ